MAVEQEPPHNCLELFNDPAFDCDDYCQHFSQAVYAANPCFDIVWGFSTGHGECEVQGLTCKKKKSCNFLGTLSVEVEEGCEEASFYFCGESVLPEDCKVYEDGLNWGTGAAGISMICGTNSHLEVKEGGNQGPFLLNLNFECCSCLAIGGGGRL